MNKFYLGLDGGGTKTHLVLADSNKKIVAEELGGGSNIHSIGENKAKENISRAIDNLFAKAGISIGDIAALCLGSAGLGRMSDKIIWESIFKDLGFNCPAALVTDSETTLVGGLHKREGIAVISGTGSICIGFGKDGNFARSGGWGHVIGDEGSGYYIGRRILNAVARSHDGLSAPTLLTELTLNHLKLTSAAELVPVIYSYTDKKDLAALSFLIQEGLEQNDEASVTIARESASELALLAEAVHKKLGLPGSFDLTTGGSVLNKNLYIRKYFKDYITERLPGTNLHTPLSPPAYGAALIAMSGRSSI